ncbi:MAG: hypothetical protein NDI82_13255, partial [Anaeromyxobacteraceae bacterium]|nr:hypothetical protein [Anaeromyxobacteraceae bacterium]
MRLLGPLLRNTFLALVLSQAMAWWMAVTVFPLSPAQLDRLRVVFLVGLALEWSLVALLLAWLTGPLRRAVALPRPLAEADER